jgi:hypothetical protein
MARNEEPARFEVCSRAATLSFLLGFLGIFFCIFLAGCSPGNDATKTARMPPPGTKRLPQVYVAWNSSYENLQLPWGPPSTQDFEEGQGARVEAALNSELQGDLKVLEDRLRNWNSRPYDMILLGPDPKMFSFAKSLELPKSEANGPRVFLATLAEFKSSTNSSDWIQLALDEAPILKLLSKFCKNTFASGKGCSFSEAALKKKGLKDLPQGPFRIGFATSVVSGAPPNDLTFKIQWESFFRQLTAKSSSWNSKSQKNILGFSDGDIKLDLRPDLPEDVRTFLQKEILGLLNGGL